MKKHVFVLFIFLFLTYLFTFPIINKINNSCLGFASTDELFAPIWTYWYWHFSSSHQLNFWTTDFLAYPFGIKIYGDFFPYVYVGLIGLLSKFLNYIAVLNMQILLNFILTGFFTYLLVYKLTKSRMAGLLSGIIFTFSPQHFIRSWQHISLSYFQWLPLYILALFKLKENPNLKQAFLTGVTLFLVASFDFHYLFFMFTATLLFICLLVIYGKNKPLKFTKYLFIGGLASLSLIITQFYRYILKIFFHHTEISSAQNIFKRPFEDLFAQSAKPLSYFLPSTEHPIFGGITKGFLGSSLYGGSLTEHNLYLGWVALFMAFLGWRMWRKKRQFLSAPDNLAFGFFFLLAFVSWLFSQPPWWNVLGFKIYMPSFYLYKILPMFRAYCRFGILLILSIAVLAGFGLKFLLDEYKSRTQKTLVAGFLCLLIIFDFWNNPPQHVIDLSKYNKAYDWLRHQDEGVVIAEYPLDIIGPNDFYKFFQTIHQKKIINGTIPGTQPHSLIKKLTRLSDSNTTRALKTMDVKYVLVHRDEYFNSELLEDKEELAKIPDNRGLKFVKNFPAGNCKKNSLCIQDLGPIDVYEVIARGYIK